MKSDSDCKVRVTIFSGGVGGAKLARGFAAAFQDHDIRIIVNTADDEVFYGLYVCPDIDTVIYHLSGIFNPDQGWGVRDETFITLNQLSILGEEVWFKLGDRDLATHLIRTRMLQDGADLTEVTQHLCQKLGITAEILPMSNDPVRTIISSGKAELPFQEYFVKQRCQVNVDAVQFKGIELANPTHKVIDAIHNADLIVFAPSNPVVSILPIVELNGLREKIRSSVACKIAVSPLIGRKALRGPAADLMPVLNHDASAAGVADFYQDLADHLFIHLNDANLKKEIESYGLRAVPSNIIMPEMADSIRLAKEIFKYFKRVSRVGGENENA
jgi:LPPG:FO 2-phospho-L-lactate transferase